jgi:hypothetical protein
MVEEALVYGVDLTDEQEAFRATLDDDVLEWLEWAVEVCVAAIADSDADQIYHEAKIPHDLVEEHGGTVDVIEYWHTTKTLQVTDFKFGRVRVDIEDNKQVMSYLNLARQRFYPEADRFIGRIIQPRFGEDPQATVFSLAQLDQHEADVIEASISDRFEAGGHCTFCPILASCQTAAEHLRDQVNEFPDLTKFVGGISGQPTEAQVEQLCKIYLTFKLAEKATEGAGVILKKWAREGANIQAHNLGLRKTTRTSWAPFSREWLEERFGEEAFEPERKLRSAVDTRKALNMTKEQFEDEFKDHLYIKDVHAIVTGRDAKEFPEFPILDD